MTGHVPPGNSLEEDQGSAVSSPGSEIVEGLNNLLDRIGEEISYNDSKGQNAFRLGVHDGLRFVEDAIANLLRQHGHERFTVSRERDV